MRGLHLGLLAGLLLSLTGAREAGAVCPTKNPGPQGGNARPQGALPPGLREPFDPPPPTTDPTDPPPPPADVPPTTPGGGAPPTTPGEAPPPSLPPGTTPPLPTGPGGPTTPRERPARGLESLDDASWELWWGLNQADVLPRVKRQDDLPPGEYARTLPPALRPAVDVLLEALDDPDVYVVQAATGALASTVTSYRVLDTLTALRRVAAGHEPFARDLAHLALGARRDAEAADAMRRVLRNRHEEVVSRGFAALALIQLQDVKGLEEVTAAAGDLTEPDVAGAVLIALGQTGDRQFLPVLTAAAERKSGSAVRLRRVRADAITALGKLGDPSVAPYLAGLLKDHEKVIARCAALALGGLKGSAEAVEGLRTAGLTSEDAFVRAFSALSLGRLGQASALPAMATRVLEEDVAVRPFTLLGLGLLKDKGATALLEDGLKEDPRTGRFGTSALAAGLLQAGDYRARLSGALTDVRTASAPACGALGLGLLASKDAAPALRNRFWFDSARSRPGFDRALALLEPEGQSAWLLGEIKKAQRSGTKQVLVNALATCGGPSEGAALAELWRATPAGDTNLKLRILAALAAIVGDRQVSPSRALLHHTYYLQPNVVLGHLAFLP